MKKLNEMSRKELLAVAKTNGIKLSKAARANKRALQAAVLAGMPREAKPAKKSKGQIVKSASGLGVQKTWEKLFLQNEAAFKAGVRNRKHPVLTDLQISQAMNDAFPGRGSAIFADVRRVRARYNRDCWSKSTNRGTTVCHRYEKVDGKMVPVSSRGSAL